MSVSNKSDVTFREAKKPARRRVKDDDHDEAPAAKTGEKDYAPARLLAMFVVSVALLILYGIFSPH